MISCKEAVRRLWAYLEDDLDEEDHRQVEAHLDLCRQCCGEAEFTGALSIMLRSNEGPAIPQRVERQLLSFIDELEESS